MKSAAFLAPIMLLVTAPVLADDQAVIVNPPAAKASFAGVWTTEFGVLKLKQEGDEVTGSYPLGSVSGTVKENVLSLRYRERVAAGDAKFTLSPDGTTFQGTWRADGTTLWQAWNGQRLLVKPRRFAGLWETSFGAMRLSGDGQNIRGAYDYAGGAATIAGQVKEQRFIFRYQEPDVEGAGWFELSEDRMSLRGKWRPDGTQTWNDWIGRRKIAEPGRVWLVILEANWERNIEEREYAFGDMLANYFQMAEARHVQVRHRFFHDAKDLQRFCSKIQFLAEPVVLLVSTHGTAEGITVSGETIAAKVLADSLRGAGNLKLLHLSGCGMMSGKFPDEIHTLLKEHATFPISGYKSNVAWDASAIGDFTFLSLLLIRGLEPEVAAQKAIIAAPYLGDARVPGSAFQPLGLTVRSPKLATAAEQRK